MNEIELTRGDTLYLQITITDDTGEEYVVSPEDKLVFTLKKDVYQKTPILQKNIQDNALIISHDDTKALQFGEYIYDVQLTQPNGDVTTVVKPTKFLINYEVNDD